MADARAVRDFLDAWQVSRDREFLRGARARLACLRGPDAPGGDPRALSALARGAQILDSAEDLSAALAVRAATSPASGAAGRAWMAGALLDLYEASFDPDHLDAAVFLGGILAREAAALAAADEEGAAAGAQALRRLSWITDDKGLLRAAKDVLARHRGRRSSPALRCAAQSAAAKPLQVVLAGAPGDPGLQEMLRLVRSRYRPDLVLLRVGTDEERERLARHMPFVRGARPIAGRATAYVCRDYVCEMPTSDLAEMAFQLGDSPTSPAAAR